MSQIEDLLAAYTNFVGLPWQEHLAGDEKVWFAVYDPAQERRLRLRLAEFEVATKQAGHAWKYLDLTDSFARWMTGHKYRDAYFRRPELMNLALTDYAQHVEAQLADLLSADSADQGTVVALGGVGSLFGLTSVSTLLEKVKSGIRGRLLVFFPGHYADRRYHLFGVGDGWNYLAIPILSDQ